MKYLFTLVFTLAVALGAGAAEYTAQSPDGKYKIEFSDENGFIEYSVSWDGRMIVAPSRLGIRTVHQYLEGLKIKNFNDKGTTDTTWDPVYGERDLVRDHYNTYVIELTRNADDPRNADVPVNIEVRAYDEGVAFRYNFTGGSYLRINEEYTEFTVPEGSMAYFTERAQTIHQLLPLKDWPGDGQSDRPLLIKLPDYGYVCLAEAQVVDYVRTKFCLGPKENTVYTAMYGPVEEIAPYHTPWRVIMYGEKAGTILQNNDIFYNLLLNTQEDAYGVPRSKTIKTTPAHQLALSVVYYSPLQYMYWYDKPSDSRDEPELKFFDDVYTVWDDTKILDGVPGEHITVARRHGEEWFVGSITNGSRKVSISLDFLPEGTHTAEIYTDGDKSVPTRTKVRVEKSKVKARDILKFNLRESGGVAIRIVLEPKKQTSFRPGEIWKDNNGVHINAHGGGVLLHKDTYYWFGEHKIEGKDGNKAHVGVHCYSSKDLYNWTDEGIAMTVSDDPNSLITKECIIERPKVIYNKNTRKFVMWFHLEPKGSLYSGALVGIAQADKVTGPYTFIRGTRCDIATWPINVLPEHKLPVKEEYMEDRANLSAGEHPDKVNTLGRDFVKGQHSRDQTLFVDDDGKAYHIRSAESNSVIHISQLTDDYLDFSGRYVRAFVGTKLEAPALFKKDGLYYIMGSECTGWRPNPAHSGVAPTIWGPWTELGNPCVDKGAETTYRSQSTYFIPVPGKEGEFIYMGDRWFPENAIDGRYVWLPVEWEDGRFILRWRDEWDLSIFDK